MTSHRTVRTVRTRLPSLPLNRTPPLPPRTKCVQQVPVFEKKLFSMCTDDVMNHVANLPNRPTDIVLFGIEAHVCVTQVCVCVCVRERDSTCAYLIET